eukprot:3380315-Pyramimonas_sp.AAC.1
MVGSSPSSAAGAGGRSSSRAWPPDAGAPARSSNFEQSLQALDDLRASAVPVTSWALRAVPLESWQWNPGATSLPSHTRAQPSA